MWVSYKQVSYKKTNVYVFITYNLNLIMNIQVKVTNFHQSKIILTKPI